TQENSMDMSKQDIARARILLKNFIPVQNRITELSKFVNNERFFLRKAREIQNLRAWKNVGRIVKENHFGLRDSQEIDGMAEEMEIVTSITLGMKILFYLETKLKQKLAFNEPAQQSLVADAETETILLPARGFVYYDNSPRTD